VGAVPAAADLRALLEDLRAGNSGVRRFAVHGPRGHHFVRTEDIETATA
jgi:hypothetical protein